MIFRRRQQSIRLGAQMLHLLVFIGLAVGAAGVRNMESREIPAMGPLGTNAAGASSQDELDTSSSSTAFESSEADQDVSQQRSATPPSTDETAQEHNLLSSFPIISVAGRQQDVDSDQLTTGLIPPVGSSDQLMRRQAVPALEGLGPEIPGLEAQTINELAMKRNINVRIPKGNYYAYGHSYVPFSRTGDVFGVFGDSLTSMFEPVLVALLALFTIIGVIWAFSAVVSAATFPLRIVFGIKKPLLRRFLVRLISYTGEHLINSFRTNFPLAGQFQVPAEGLEISRPAKGDIPGFTLSMPPTTIRYTYSLSEEAVSKLQALLDAFNEVFNVQQQGGSGGAGASGRELPSQEEDADARFARIRAIAGDIRKTIGESCTEDNPVAIRDSKIKELCRRANQAMQLATAIVPADEGHG